MIGFAQDNGAKGLAYVIFQDGAGKGPIAKLLSDAELDGIRQATGVGDGDAVFFSCAKLGEAERIAGAVRTRTGDRTRSARGERVPLLLDRRLPDVRATTSN